MAKQTDKELTVEEKLKALYELQQILSKIDEYKIQRGELPLEVKDLEDEIVRYQTRINNLEGELVTLTKSKGELSRAIEEANALIAKYTEQQQHVRNNREYDFLSKEIEFQQLDVKSSEKKMRDAAAKYEQKQNDIANSKQALDDSEHILENKKQELEEIMSETKQDEERLREKAKKIEGKIDERLLYAFKRIRKNARNGLGIAYIYHGACGGCFNRIPPQRQAEINMHKKIIVCEYCGRILVDPELAGIKVETPAPQEKKTRTRKKLV